MLSPRTDGSTWLLNPAPVAISGVVDIDGHSQWVEVPATSGTQNFSSDLPVKVSPVLCDQTNDQLAVTNGRIRICWNQLGEMVQLLDCQTGRSLMG